MGDKRIKKYIPSTALAIMLGISNVQTINAFANGNDINNIEEGNITQVNLLNLGGISNIEDYINNLNNTQEGKLEENQAIHNNKLFISNIKNTYNLMNSNIFIENEVPMLAANLVLSENNNLIYEPYTIKEFEGANVGIIGIVSKNNTANTQNEFVITDELEAMNKYTKELLEKGIENIIVVTDMELSTNIEENTFNIFEGIDNQVDVIISESELNIENKYEDIKTQDKEFLFVQTDDNTVADINLSINKENNTIENKEVSFINNEEVVPEEEETTNNEQNENIDNNSDNNDEDNLGQSIEPYVIGGILGGTENPNNQGSSTNNPPANNSNESNDDDDDKDEEDEDKDKESDEDKDDEDDKDEDDDKDDDEDEDDEDEDEDDEDDEDEDDEDDKDDEKDKKSSIINPKTGDSSIFMYALGCVGSILGLSMNKTKKEKK